MDILGDHPPPPPPVHVFNNVRVNNVQNDTMSTFFIRSTFAFNLFVAFPVFFSPHNWFSALYMFHVILDVIKVIFRKWRFSRLNIFWSQNKSYLGKMPFLLVVNLFVIIHIYLTLLFFRKKSCLKWNRSLT